MAGVNGKDAEQCLLSAHGRALMMLSAQMGCHYQGLAQAAQACRQLPPPLRKWLIEVHVAFALARHVTRLERLDGPAEGGKAGPKTAPCFCLRMSAGIFCNSNGRSVQLPTGRWPR